MPLPWETDPVVGQQPQRAPWEQDVPVQAQQASQPMMVAPLREGEPMRAVPVPPQAAQPSNPMWMIPELQTLLRAGQGVTQLGARAIGQGAAVEPGIQGQNQSYEESKRRAAAASVFPRATEALLNTREMMGNLLNPMGMVGGNIANPILRGMASASGFAASQPVLDPQANFWLEKAKQQAVAVPMGAITGALTAPPKTPIPTTKEIKAQKTAAYEQIASEPVPVTSEMLSSVQDRAGKTAIKNAANDALINRETALADELNSLLSDSPPTHVSANAADKLSQSFRDLGSAAMRADRGNASRGWFGRRNDVEDALTSVPDIKSARTLNTRYENSKLIDETIQAAKDNYITPGGTADLNQALRREFGKLVRNDEAMRFYSEAEKEAIKAVANGTFTANMLQRLGKWSPVRNHLSALIDVAAAVGGQSLIGGIEGTLPAIAMAGIGEGARLGGIAATSRNAALASQLVRSGGLPQTPPVFPGPAPNVPVGNLPPALLLQLLAKQPRPY